MKKSTIITIISTILFYLLFLSLYLLDVINGIAFVLILLAGFVILFISFIIFLILFFVLRKKLIMGKIAFANGILFVLFCYEAPLVLYPVSLSHYAYGYQEPTETLKGSGIYTIGVSEYQIANTKNKKEVEELLSNEQTDVLSVEEVNNKVIYGVKNRQLLTWLHLQKEHSPDESKENVIQYLGEEGKWLENYFAQTDLGGDSAGLSLALSGRYEKGDFENHLPIAVTGAIDANGDVFEVGILKEKIQITEKAGISYLIIPSKNAKEVEKIQKDLKANVEVFDVSTVDEAIQVIKILNK